MLHSREILWGIQRVYGCNAAATYTAHTHTFDAQNKVVKQLLLKLELILCVRILKN